MLGNLEAELARNGISKKDVAMVIGKSYTSTTQKIKGDYPFTYEEAATIQKQLFPSLDIKYLFQKTEK